MLHPLLVYLGPPLAVRLVPILSRIVHGRLKLIRSQTPDGPGH